MPFRVHEHGFLSYVLKNCICFLHDNFFIYWSLRRQVRRLIKISSIFVFDCWSMLLSYLSMGNKVPTPLKWVKMRGESCGTLKWIFMVGFLYYWSRETRDTPHTITCMSYYPWSNQQWAMQFHSTVIGMPHIHIISSVLPRYDLPCTSEDLKSMKLCSGKIRALLYEPATTEGLFSKILSWLQIIPKFNRNSSKILGVFFYNRYNIAKPLFY